MLCSCSSFLCTIFLTFLIGSNFYLKSHKSDQVLEIDRIISVMKWVLRSKNRQQQEQALLKITPEDIENLIVSHISLKLDSEEHSRENSKESLPLFLELDGPQGEPTPLHSIHHHSISIHFLSVHRYYIQTSGA